MTPANLSHVNVELDIRRYLAKKPNLQSEQESTATEEDIRYESVIWLVLLHDLLLITFSSWGNLVLR